MMALLFGLVGLLFNPFLVLIALFVWMGAAQEASMVQVKSALDGIPISKAMMTDFRTLSSHDSLEQAAQHVLSGYQQDFPVVENGQLVGVLTWDDLLRALSQHDRVVEVGQAMHRQFETADPSEMLEAVFARLQTGGYPSLPIVRDGRVIGVITLDNIGEFLMMQNVLNHKSKISNLN
jgi:CBS domain-containing protein